MTINCLGKLVDLTVPKVLGILNLTPDSFYDGGSLKDETSILNKVEEMLNDGVDFVDLGGYSSRPGANDVSLKEELNRVVPVVKLLKEKFPNILMSIDTFRSQVAENCINEGAAIINDISASKIDPSMLTVIAKYKVPYIVMHMRGTPQTMQSLTDYEDVTKEICFYFSELIFEARKLGVDDLIVDPGFGFAKTKELNFELLNSLDFLKRLNVPLLTGISRKSMIYKTLNITAKEALNGTTALHMVALQKGANILRVHDVKEAKECILLYEALKAYD